MLALKVTCLAGHRLSERRRLEGRGPGSGGGRRGASAPEATGPRPEAMERARAGAGNRRGASRSVATRRAPRRPVVEAMWLASGRVRKIGSNSEELFPEKVDAKKSLWFLPEVSARASVVLRESAASLSLGVSCQGLEVV